MKKNLPLGKTILSILFLAILNFSSKSQTLGLSVSNTSSCVTTGTNPVYASITSTVSGAIAYSYSVIQTCSGGTVHSSAGTYTTLNPTIFLACPGPYTLFCNAIGSGSTVVGSATATGAFNTASLPSISISPNNGAGCVGTTFTINLSGASNYTTFGASIPTQTNTTIVVTPSVSSCFSVVASNGTCTTNSIRCFTLYAPPSINLSPTLAACSNNPNFTISPTGAASYTWNTGSTSQNLIVSSSVSACYTVTGSNPFCAGTSSAVTCVTLAPGPTLSIGSSTNALCLGSGGVTLSVSGANQYTQTIYRNGFYVAAYNSSNVVFTPTLTGNYNVQIQGLSSSFCYAYGSLNFTVNTPPNVSTTNMITICSTSGGATNLFVSGATNYTWSNGSTSNNPFVTVTTPTCFTVIGSNPGCSLTSSAVACVTLASSPTLNITGPTSVCAGSTNLYNVSGASNYTWSALSSSLFALGSSWNINSSLGCVMVTGYNSSGCGATSTICPVVMSNPTITPNSANFGLCSGNSLTLAASGANSYTWSNGSTGSSIVVSPSSNQCYTVIGANAAGCVGTAVRCVTIYPNPNISISGATSACPGSNLTYTASGALGYIWWNNSTNDNTITVNTNAAGCYSVAGWTANGCSVTVTKCFTPSPVPLINVSGNNSVCIGSSATFTANGGTTYTWSTGANTNTLNVLPTASTNYTLSASHALNACTNSTVVALTVYTNCAIVWPGDANRDGQVDNTDVFELGLAANSTGAARTSASNSWNGQFASAWTGTVSSGWNKVHADCNGNGTINAADTLAISLNYSLTHVFKNTNTSSGIDLFFSPQNSEAYSGIWNVIDIILGDANNVQSQIYGAAFDLDFDKSMVENDSVKLVYNNSFLNAGGQNIEFKKSFFNNGKLFTTSVRTNQSDVNGNGKIAELWIKLRSDVPDNSSFNFGISNGKRTNANGVMGVLNTSGGMNLNVNANATSLIEKLALSNTIRFYPNPANNFITLKNDLNIKTSYHLFDLTGRCVLSGEFTSTKNLDVSTINKGIYIIEFETPLHKIQKKLVKE
jgi:hypothetical protein